MSFTSLVILKKTSCYFLRSVLHLILNLKFMNWLHYVILRMCLVPQYILRLDQRTGLLWIDALMDLKTIRRKQRSKYSTIHLFYGVIATVLSGKPIIESNFSSVEWEEMKEQSNFTKCTLAGSIVGIFMFPTLSH